VSAPAITDPRLAAPEPQAEQQGRQPPAAAESPWPQTVALLCDEFAEACRSAVDPLEIASALEFEGLSDQAAKLQYGYPDVFALARDMYFEVARRPAEPAGQADPWQSSKLRPAMHSLLYGVPAVCFAAVAGLFSGPGVLTALIVALLVAWSLAQGLAYLGYLRLGQLGPDQARNMLRAGLAVALLLVAGAMLATRALTGAHWPVLAFGAGEGAYMLGAGVLMVLGSEGAIFAALAPGVVGGTAFLLAGRPHAHEDVLWTVLAGTPLLAVALALARTRSGGRPGAWRLGLADVPGLVAATAFGLTAASLLVFPVAVGVAAHGRVNPGALLAILPLSLSMGVAEWSLLWYRRRARALMRTGTDVLAFGIRVRLTLVAAALQYTAAAVALIAIAVLISRETGILHVSWADAPQVTAYLLLGVAMFLALTVQALGLRAFPVAACALAIAVEVALRHHEVIAQLVACGGLLIVLGGYALITLGRPMRHVY
jgi:hypothetical protein